MSTAPARRLHFPRKSHMAGGSSSPANPPQASAATASAEEMEEYQNWKKNAAVLYNLVISHPLEWPSLTVQWLTSESPTRSHKLVVGTHTSDEAPNYLKLLDATLPISRAEKVFFSVPVVPFQAKFSVLVALLEENVFITRAYEDLVDVVWHLKDENIFGSVGDDCKLMMWDLRTNKPEQSIAAHQKQVNSLSFNPFNEWILATASGDATIKLFDLRKLSRSLYTFDSHDGEVFQVEWNRNLATVLASSAADKRVMIWDVNRIGDEQSEEDANDGPPELLFVHGGHTAKISELPWNPSEKWVVASVAEDNILQIWEMAESIYSDDYYQQDNDCPTAQGRNNLFCSFFAGRGLYAVSL